MRHGETECVAEKSRLRTQMDALPEDEKQRAHYKQSMVPQYVDAVLSDKGVTGSEQALTSLEGLNFSNIILVSPLRRTIQTACHLLKDHPRKKDFTLKLEPMARELMTYSNVMLCSGSYL